MNTSLLAPQLDYLKLPFLKAQYDELAQQAARQPWTHVEYLARLIDGQYQQRREHAVALRVQAARFPVIKTLEQFHWDWPKKINRLQVQNLFRLEFVAHRANVVLLGHVGVGKTHLATALGYAACQEGYAVLFADAISVINDLSAAHKRGLLRWGGRGGGGAKDCTLYNCTVTGNSGGGADGTLHNCLVTGYEGGSGGNLYGCTVVGNNGGVSGSVFNSIVYYNSGGNYAEGTALNYCCTFPLPTNGVGNIIGPPLFMDMTAGDFRLGRTRRALMLGRTSWAWPSQTQTQVGLLPTPTMPPTSSATPVSSTAMGTARWRGTSGHTSSTRSSHPGSPCNLNPPQTVGV